MARRPGDRCEDGNIFSIELSVNHECSPPHRQAPTTSRPSSTSGMQACLGDRRPIARAVPHGTAEELSALVEFGCQCLKKQRFSGHFRLSLTID
jgi:hypothetical protein